jgi:hypothetical protein
MLTTRFASSSSAPRMIACRPGGTRTGPPLLTISIGPRVRNATSADNTPSPLELIRHHLPT